VQSLKPEDVVVFSKMRNSIFRNKAVFLTKKEMDIFLNSGLGIIRCFELRGLSDVGSYFALAKARYFYFRENIEKCDEDEGVFYSAEQINILYSALLLTTNHVCFELTQEILAETNQESGDQHATN